MHYRPQTAGGMTPSPLGNLRAFCSMFCLLFICSSFSRLLSGLSLPYCVHFLQTSFASALPTLSLPRCRNDSLSMSPQSRALLAFSSLAAKPHHHTPLTWLPSLFSSQLSPSHLSTLFIFHIKQSFPWSQLCKQWGPALHVFSEREKNAGKTWIQGARRTPSTRMIYGPLSLRPPLSTSGTFWAEMLVFVCV